MVATYGKYVVSIPTKNVGRDELANEKTIFNYFTMKTFNLPKVRPRCRENWNYVKYNTSSPCCCGDTNVNQNIANFSGKFVQCAVNV